ncbi:hypothetical protein Athai_00210 [Actinocatenispora thailandica]|uniref:ABC3 transporter permease C-terminal domain-containing protein n=1 Tax=Actinocatenispora thailandica TaxID=227318 RepID=A0A7R7DJ04_9ACTN|nr:FtsX-like permease family protein [Actinocatenispora thailandica]BCJ32518.1 hypothetical protein Athai_00210 [Actinocatenispora thailandica]
MTAATGAPGAASAGTMSPHTLLRLARAGTRTDTVRIALTVLGSAAATLGLLAVGTVLSIPVVASRTDSTFSTAHYTNELLAEYGLRKGLSVGLLLVTIPVLLFVVQCARLGAPARERRLAALRMAGATPADVVRVVATESGLAACAGAALGAVVYLVGRVLADAPDSHGYRPLPTDVLPPWWALVVLIALVPVLVVALSVLLLRRVVATPHGITRKARTGRPATWPVVLLAIGAAMVISAVSIANWTSATLLRSTDNAAIQHEAQRIANWAFQGSLVVGVGLILVGLVFGAARLSHLAGVVVRRFARRPAVLLAAGRAASDPWLGGRSLSVLFAAVLFGAGAAALRQGFRLNDRANNAMADLDARYAGTHPEHYVDAFYGRAFDIVDLGVRVVLVVAAAALLTALVERVVGQRRQLAAATAAGVPRRTLGAALVLHALVTTAPGVVIAALVGMFTGRAIVPSYDVTQAAGVYCVDHGSVEPCYGADSKQLRHLTLPELHVHVTAAVPWGQVGLIVGIALAAVAGTALLSLSFLRVSTRIEDLRTG